MIVGGGPAGLAAAGAARAEGADVTVLESKRSVGRKFLVAGKGGLNLTHAEPLDDFLKRYREGTPSLAPFVRAYPPDRLRELAASLGQPTYVGSSDRVFPKDGKAAPMLRAWVQRLKRDGVFFRTHQRWTGFSATGPRVDVVKVLDAASGKTKTIRAGAVVLALGGGSWPDTGSDGEWVSVLRAGGVDVADLVPANAGVDVAWPAPFLAAAEGTVIKHVTLSCDGETASGDIAITFHGMEGTPVYRLTPLIRAALARSDEKRATVFVDLKPDLTVAALAAKLARGTEEGRSSKSLSTRVNALGLGATAIALLRTRPRDPLAVTPEAIAAGLKSFPVTINALRPLAEAISTAGGIRWSALDASLMLRALPGVFAAGEMIDWEAPTGGYLLQACVSTGHAAGTAAARYARDPRTPGAAPE